MNAHISQFTEEVNQHIKNIQRLDVSSPVVFYGSSSFRLWNSLSDDFPDQSILNLGFGGSSIVACNYFFEQLIPPSKPSSLVFYAGDNDIGNGANSNDIARRFNTFLQLCDQFVPQTPVTFVSIKPSIERQHLVPTIQQANEKVKGLISARPNTYYLDVHSAMLNEDGSVKTEIFEEDQLHLNQAGYDIWREVFRSESGKKVFV